MRHRFVVHIVLLFILLCGCGLSLPAQQDWSWVLGDSVLMRFPGGGAPVVDLNVRTRYQLENGSCIGDQAGNLLLYANKDSAFSVSGVPVVGGRLFTWGEITNGTTILPVIGDSTTYQIFYITSGLCAGVTCPRMATVRVHPAGDTVIAHYNLGQYDPLNLIAEKVSAVKDAGGSGWWVFYHGTDDNKFIRFHVQGTQVSPLAIQAIGSSYEYVGLNALYALGEMSFSAQGDKLLAVTMTGIVDLFDFDRCTGQLSNWLPLGTPALQVPGPNVYYGCSFSPDGTKIYVSENFTIPAGCRLYQWDLTAPNIAASKTLIFTAPDSVDIGQHQLGPDGKIYIAQKYTVIADSDNVNNFHLGVIHYPNQAGLACNFVYQSLYLQGRQSTLHLPNFPNYNLAPLVAQNAQAGPPQVVLCAGDSVLLGYPDTTGGAVSFAWNSHPDISDTTQPQHWVTLSQSTWYYLTVVDSAVGIPCGVTRDSVHVIVADSSLFPVATAGNDTIVCYADTVRVGGVGVPGWQYAWSGGGFIESPSLASTPVFGAGTYTVIVTNPIGVGACLADTDFVVVDTFAVFPNPVPTDTTICLGDSLVLGMALPSSWAGNWTPSAGLVFPDSVLTLAYPPVSATYTLYATDTSNPGGCATLRDTVYVRVEVPFKHEQPENQEFCLGEILQIGVPSVSAFAYAWSPITGLQNPYISATTVAPLTPIVYTLAVTSDTMISENCKTQYFPVALTTDGCIHQNVVTPNGDGINDFLDLGSFNGPVSVSIYDRWGALVFASDGYGNDWPENGSALPESVYYYVVRVANEGGKAFVGEVMVVR